MKPTLPILALLLSAAVSHAWDLKPDPPADKPWAPQPDLDVRVEKSSFVVGFAQQNGPFVLVQRPDRRREVFDLRTGQSVARYTPLPLVSGHEGLSPGGTLSAIPSGGKSVRLLELATGKERPAVAVDGGVVSFAFASDARLVVVGLNAGKRYVALFDTVTGKETARHPIDPSGYEQFPSLRPMAVSPGGKHVAVRCDRAINVYDLADGKKLAALELPELTPGVNRQPGAVAVAFSADGRELAAVVRKANTEAGTLILWDTTDGTKTEHPLDKQTSLDPVLSGGWVVGFEVVNGGKKTPLLSVKELPSAVRLAVSPEQVIALDNRGQLSAIRTFGGSGGGGTPSGAKEVPTDATAKWDGVKVGDPVPPSTAPHWSANVGDERVNSLTLPLDGRRAFVESADSLTPGVGVRTVRVVEPGKPDVLHTFPLPEGRIVIGETATSDAILTTDVPGKADPKVRLKVFTAEGKSLGDGWVLPFASELPQYAAVAGPTRVVTLTAGRITAWQVPEGKAIWTTEFREANGGGISPDGKLLFVTHPGGVRAIDVDTGGTLGNLRSVGLFASPPRDENRVAFSGDRQQLAMLSVAGRTVRVWDLTSGTQTTTVSLQAVESNAPLRFLSSRFLLVGDGVYDLSERRKTWGLKGPVGQTVVASGGAADGRLWYAVSARGAWSVAAAPFPADALARALDGDDPTGGRFQRGEKVKLEIEAPAGAPPGWDAQARAAARRALGTAKLTEDPAATTVVRVTFATVPGESVKMKWQGIENFGREETIKKFSVENRGVVIRNGQTAYTAPPTRTEMRIKEWPQVNEIDDDSKSGQEFFARQVWRNAALSSGYVFTAGQDPKKVGDRIMGKPDGEAKLDKDGLSMNWPAGMEPKGVEGDPTLAPAPTPPGVVPASAWVLWVVGGGCGGLLLAAGAVVLVVVLAAKRRKKLDDERPRRRR